MMGKFTYPDKLFKMKYVTKRFKQRVDNLEIDGDEFIEKLQQNIVFEKKHPLEMIIHSFQHCIRNARDQYIVLKVKMRYQDYCRLSLLIPNEYDIDIYDDCRIFTSNRVFRTSGIVDGGTIPEINVNVEWETVGTSSIHKSFWNIHLTKIYEFIRFIPCDEEAMLMLVRHKLEMGCGGSEVLRNCAEYGFNHLRQDVKRYILENGYVFHTRTWIRRERYNCSGLWIDSRREWKF